LQLRRNHLSTLAASVKRSALAAGASAVMGLSVLAWRPAWVGVLGVAGGATPFAALFGGEEARAAFGRSGAAGFLFEARQEVARGFGLWAVALPEQCGNAVRIRRMGVSMK
jgi:hypothetical protein